MYTAISDDQFVSLVERQRPLKEFKKQAPDQAALLNSYASFLERRFPVAMCDDACIACGGQSTQVHEFTWRAIFHTNANAIANAIGLIGLFGGQGWTTYNAVDATTYHSFCRPCGRGLWLRQNAGVLIEKLCFVLLLLGGAALMVSALYALALFFRHPTTRENMVFGGGLLFGSIGLWLAIVGIRFARRWPLPKRISAFIKHPFSLHQQTRL